MGDKLSMKKIIVKKEYVTEVQGLLNYLIEKLDLNQVVEFVNSMIHMLLDQIKSFALMQSFSEFISKILARLELFKKVSII